jgi:hypothetical protein
LTPTLKGAGLRARDYQTRSASGLAESDGCGTRRPVVKLTRTCIVCMRMPLWGVARVAAEPDATGRDQRHQQAAEKPVVLAVEFYQIIASLPQPYRTMVRGAVHRTSGRRFAGIRMLRHRLRKPEPEGGLSLRSRSRETDEDSTLGGRASA